MQTEVSVQETTPLLNAESGTLGTTITQRVLTDTPLANRSVLDLAVTVPNISGDVGTEDPQISGTPVPGFNLNVNGGRSGSTNFLADGVSNTGVGIAREAVAFSPETVQEFTVQTNAFSAEYGKSGGGIISVTTKSGTNDFNGLALWYLRNPVLNANPYTQATVNRPVENLRWNQFDGQLGGPVIIPKLYNGRNKTFFFFAGEPRYQSDHLQAVANLPTTAMRQGDFSNLVAANGSSSSGMGWVPTSVYNQFKGIAPGAFNTNSTAIYQQYNLVGNQLKPITLPAGTTTYQPFAGNRIPTSFLDPSALQLINKYLPPAGNYFVDSNGYMNNYVAYRYVSTDQTRYTLRLDQIISDRNHLTFRMTKVPEVGTIGFDPNYPTNGNGGSYSVSQQYMADYTRTITPTIYNDLRLAYTRGNFSGANTPEYDINTGQNLSKQFGLPSLTNGGLPMFSFELDNFGVIGSQGSQLNQNLEQQYEIADTLYVSHGPMTWKFGVDLHKDLLNTLNYYSASGGNYSFRYVQTDSTGNAGTNLGGIGVASFLLGVPNAITLANSVVPYYYRWNGAAGFVQNDWKVRPNLTLNLGLRYSLQLPRTEEYNHQGVFDPSLARTVQLKTPYTVPGINQTITSATEIPFAFDGYGGRSRYLTPIRWMDFEPRFGFAYQPAPDWVIRGGYGLSHVPLTGNNRQPVPSFAAGTPNFSATAGQTDPSFATRLSSNPPYDPFVPVNTLLGLDNNPSGLVYGQAINFPAYVLTGENAVGYVQNWNLSIQRQFGSKNILEAAYVGSKGTHLYMPNVNINNPPAAISAQLESLNQNPTGTTVPDPLGRLTPNGTVARDTLASLFAPYFGFGAVSTILDASGNSIRHGAYVNFTRRASPGLTLMTNFTFAKSIDDASDASPDKGVLTTSNLGGGQYSFGGTAAGDRSVSTFDVPYTWNTTFIYDLPYGKGRRFGSDAWGPLRWVLGDWTTTGIERIHSGYPGTVTMADGNYISTATHGVRPDIVPGVPVVNPLYDSNCPTSATCQPYLNPAAFERPAFGQLGNAPRTLSMARGPWQQTFDISVQKSWNIGEKRRIQFRVDMINAFNHPVFRNAVNDAGGTDIFGSAPNFTPTAATIASNYTTWAAANGQPAANSAQGKANIAAIQSMVLGQEVSGVLPARFYSVPLPQGFGTMNANQFDLTTLNGYKLYNLRQAYTSGFGTLSYNSQINSPRYIQLGIKIFF